MHRVVYVGAPVERPAFRCVEVLKIEYLDLSPLHVLRKDLVLTSKRGVIALNRSGVRIESVKVYCIGSITARYLRDLYGIRCSTPDEENTVALAELVGRDKNAVVIVSSDSLSGDFIEKLNSLGKEYEIITAYRILENERADLSPLSDCERILVGSPKSAEILFRRARNLIEGVKIYAIGKPTFAKLKSLGLRPVKYFMSPDIHGIMHKLEREEL